MNEYRAYSFLFQVKVLNFIDIVHRRMFRIIFAKKDYYHRSSQLTHRISTMERKPFLQNFFFFLARSTISQEDGFKTEVFLSGFQRRRNERSIKRSNENSAGLKIVKKGWRIVGRSSKKTRADSLVVTSKLESETEVVDVASCV